MKPKIIQRFFDDPDFGKVKHISIPDINGHAVEAMEFNNSGHFVVRVDNNPEVTISANHLMEYIKQETQ